jgi:hypothetical protein
MDGGRISPIAQRRRRAYGVEDEKELSGRCDPAAQISLGEHLEFTWLDLNGARV